MRRPIMRCTTSDCALEFDDEQQYRTHCIGHIELNIAAARAQRKIHLPTETWTGALGRCGRESLKERVCFTQRHFHEISRRLLDGRPNEERVLPEMVFWSSNGGNSALLKRTSVKGANPRRLVEVPVAEVPPPETVVGFSIIELNYFNAEVLQFLWCIHRLLNNGIWLELDIHSNIPNWKAPNQAYKGEYGIDRNNVAALECLLRAFPRLSITSLCILSGISLIKADLLDRLLANVRHLIIGCAPPVPESKLLTGTCCQNCSPCIPALVKWLHSPPVEEGHPKMVVLELGTNIENFAAIVSQAQQHFTSSNAAAPVAYFVVISSSASFADGARIQLPFRRIRNEQNNEMLTLRHYTDRTFFQFTDIAYNFVLFRRGCSSSTDDDASEESELLATRKKFDKIIFELRNRLELNLSRMGEIDESLFPLDSEECDEESKDREEAANISNVEPGPSSAKKAKMAI